MTQSNCKLYFLFLRDYIVEFHYIWPFYMVIFIYEIFIYLFWMLFKNCVLFLRDLRYVWGSCNFFIKLVWLLQILHSKKIQGTTFWQHDTLTTLDLNNNFLLQNFLKNSQKIDSHIQLWLLSKKAKQTKSNPKHTLIQLNCNQPEICSNVIRFLKTYNSNQNVNNIKLIIGEMILFQSLHDLLIQVKVSKSNESNQKPP